MSSEPALMSLVSVAKAIAGKKLSSREVTQSCLDRIAQWQPRVNAFMSIEAEAALAAADAADAALANGKNLGPLHGVPMAHKDMYYDAGKVVISRAGAMPLSQSLDTVGPLAQSVEDCALLVGLMAGADPEDPTASTLPVPNYMAATTGSLKGLKIGVPTAFYVDDLDSEVARVLDETIATLRKEGAKIVKVELPDQRQLTAACQIVLATEAAAIHKRWMIERPQDYGAQVLMRLQNGLAIPAVTYLEAMRWRGPALAAYLAAVEGTDAVIAPGARMPAP